MDLVDIIFKFVKEEPNAFGILAAIFLVALGYIIKHFSDLRVRRYEARLAFVTAQLRDLYGPLYLLSESGDRIWHEFRQRFRPGFPMFDPKKPLSKEERGEYITWLDSVFVPSNKKMRLVIENNAHLFLEGAAPSVILDLLVHFDDLEVVLAKLKESKDDNPFPTAFYPKKFSSYVKQSYLSIVDTHSKLIAKRGVKKISEVEL